MFSQKILNFEGVTKNFDQVCFHCKETVRLSRPLMINISITTVLSTFRMCTIKLFYQQLDRKLFKWLVL